MTFTLNICAICGTAFQPPRYKPARTCSRQCAAVLGHDHRGNARRSLSSAFTIPPSQRAAVDRARADLMKAWTTPRFDVDAVAHAFARLREFVVQGKEPKSVIEGQVYQRAMMLPDNQNREAS